MLSVLFPSAIILVSLYNPTFCSPSQPVDNDDLGYFWQITDIHYDLDYTSPRCVGSYGNYSCDSPWKLVLSAIDTMRSLYAKPDFIIMSGDGGAHSKNLSEARLQHTIQRISTYLNSKFSVYVLPSLGNHDVFPANQLSIEKQDTKRLAWCHRLASDEKLWGRWIHHAKPSSYLDSNRSLPYANFSEGCFFSHPLRIPSNDPDRTNNLLLVSLNGLMWYNGNPSVNLTADNSVPDPLNQFEWLEQTFEWARQTGWKMLLVSHFPLGASENTPRIFRYLRPKWNARLVQLLRNNADLLMAGLFAHTHVDSFKLVRDDKGNPVASLLNAPSLSPLHLRGLGSFNPRIRLYRYKRSTSSLLGYRQFYLKLTSPETVDWQLEYDTLVDYNLIDLSPHSLQSLLHQFQNDSDAKTGPWARYWSHELGGRPHDLKPDFLTPKGLCPEAHSSCRCEHLCPMTYVDLNMLQSCLDNCSSVFDPTSRKTHSDSHTQGVSTGASGGTNSLSIVAGVIVVFLATLVGIVFCVNREICRRHRKHHITGLPDILFSNLANGGTSYPRSGTSTLLVGSVENDVDLLNSENVSMNGSLTELHLSFHPQNIMYGDVNPLVTIHPVPKSLSAVGLKNKRLHHVNRTNKISVPDSGASHNTPISTRPLSHGDAPFINGTPELNPSGMSNGQFSTDSIVSRTEDYYADDEACEWDSNDHSTTLPNGDQTNGVLSDADDEDEVDVVHFQLDFGRTPLTNKSKKLNGKSVFPDLGGSNPVKLRSNRQTPTIPLKQSQSVTMGLNSTPSHQSSVGAGERRNSLIDQRLSSATAIINRLSEELTVIPNSAPSYEYVRM